jgi:hypothetical protein
MSNSCIWPLAYRVGTTDASYDSSECLFYPTKPKNSDGLSTIRAEAELPGERKGTICNLPPQLYSVLVPFDLTPRLRCCAFLSMGFVQNPLRAAVQALVAAASQAMSNFNEIEVDGRSGWECGKFRSVSCLVTSDTETFSE